MWVPPVSDTSRGHRPSATSPKEYGTLNSMPTRSLVLLANQFHCQTERHHEQAVIAYGAEESGDGVRDVLWHPSADKKTA